MRDRLIFLAVLLGAAALAALVVLGRPRPPAPDLASSASAASPSSPSAVAPSASASVKASASASAAAPPPVPDYVRVNPEGPAACGEGMVLVDGIYCPYVGHTCTKFLIEERDVCQSYAPDVLCEGRLQHRRY